MIDTIQDEKGFANNYKVQRFKTDPNKSISISSGSLILSIGFGTGLTLHAIFLPLSLGLFEFDAFQGTGLSGIINLLIFLFATIIFDPFSIISYFILGFFTGGFIASIVYGVEGKKGPKYSVILAFSITISITFITGMISINSSEYGTVSEIFGNFIVLIGVAFIFAFIAIPLSLIAWIGYKIGIYFGAG